MYKLQSKFTPAGDQKTAIAQLTKRIIENYKHNVLLGVTGSGKTFTIANVIQNLNKPTLVLAPNKTLASQLYKEFKQFFPNNLVEYYVSHFDYYRPETYIIAKDKYLQKDSAINTELQNLRVKAISALATGRRDVIIVSSVSCIYGASDPSIFRGGRITLEVGQCITMRALLLRLNKVFYNRTSNTILAKGEFNVLGDTIIIKNIYGKIYRITFWGDEIEEIEELNSKNRKIKNVNNIEIYPTTMYFCPDKNIKQATEKIQEELTKHIEFLEKNNNFEFADRIKKRTLCDIEMLREIGYCDGIENYSVYLENRSRGTRPLCLLDHFPSDFLMVIDESHIAIPQLNAMHKTMRKNKLNLIEYGFRLPSALDSGPLTFSEFEQATNQIIYVSATPGDYELQKTDGVVVEQIVRPTYIVEPQIAILPTTTQVDDALELIQNEINNNNKIICNTITKKQSENLAAYFNKLKLKSVYIHSEVDVLDRVQILEDLRNGVYDIIIGVNLLREGIDLPEVSLVLIFDADKEGFLRNYKSLTQLAGRAARNINGRVVMFADTITGSILKTIQNVEYRWKKQMEYNLNNNTKPATIQKNKRKKHIVVSTKKTKKQQLDILTKKMKDAVKNEDFLDAAMYRDLIIELKK